MEFPKISVGKTFVLAFLLTCAPAVYADDFQICWTPPTEFVNGDPLLEQDLQSYDLYINDQNVMTFAAIVGTWCVTYTTHVEGTYTVDMTVTHVNGQTSDRSNQQVFTLGPRRPKAPSNLTVVAL